MEWVLDLRNDVLTVVFRAFTALGGVTFFMVFLPLGYWFYRREIFRRAIVLLMLSALLNSLLKGIFQVPRPGIAHLVEAEGWSFPSGHAQTAATLWTWLALEIRQRWAWVLAPILVLGVAASRVYLGVHYPRDVLVGMAVGLLIVAAASLWTRRPHPFLDELAPPWLGLVTALGMAALAVVIPGEEANPVVLAAGGFLVGFVVGTGYQRRGFEAPSPRAAEHLLLAGVLGLAVVFVLRAGLKMGFEALGLPAAMADALRYAVMGAWLSYGALWLFRRVGLSGSPGPAS